MASTNPILILGGGLAGASAAETLRQEGYDGALVIVSTEADRPYHRPPLSKAYVRGEAERESTFVHPESFYAENEIELLLSTRVTELDPASSEAALADGRRIRYEQLLLATGSEPRRLPLPGSDLDEILYLRELPDSEQIRERLERGGRLVVIGAGFIGSEIAASARYKGLDVTIIERSSVPLQHVLGRELGVVYHELHASEGVDLVPGATIEAFEGNGRVERARLADGRTFDCDFVVVGVGIEPRVQLAEAAGLAVDDGVVTDELLRTDVEGIFAAGDVASAYHPFFERRLRIEHWSNARYQAPAAALNMLGRGKAYDRIPTFFSEQYGVSLDYVGFAQSWDQVVIRGDTSERELVAFYLVDGRVMAALAIDVPDQRDVLADLIRARSRLDRSRLADPDIPLSELVETPTRT